MSITEMIMVKVDKERLVIEISVIFEYAYPATVNLRNFNSNLEKNPMVKRKRAHG